MAIQPPLSFATAAVILETDRPLGGTIPLLSDAHARHGSSGAITEAWRMAVLGVAAGAMDGE